MHPELASDEEHLKAEDTLEEAAIQRRLSAPAGRDGSGIKMCRGCPWETTRLLWTAQ